MSYTYTESTTNTYTKSRARYVIGKTYDDIMAIFTRGLIPSLEKAESYIDDLTYLIDKKAISKFQIIFYRSNGKKPALEYVVSDDGTLYEDSPSGGIDYFQFPKNTTVGLWVKYRKPIKPSVREEMKRRGWGPGSGALGNAEYDRAYSKDQYGFRRHKIGDWE